MSLATGLPALATFAICWILVSRSGGVEATTWLPAALLQLGLLVVLAVLVRRIAIPRVTLAATGALATLTVWSFLSIAWADVRAPAWDGANLTLFYLVAFAALALWPVRPAGAAAALTAFAAGLVVLGALTLREGIGAADPAAAVIYARRLSEPLGYPNATAIVFGMGAWTMLSLSLQQWLGRWWRALAVGLAVALAQLDFLAQSRGAVYTTPIVLVVYFVLAKRRLRAAAPIAILALVSAPAVPTLLAVYDSEGAAAQRDALGAAAGVLAASSVAAVLVAALILPLLDRAPAPSPSRRRRLRIVGAGAGIAAVALLFAFASPAARGDRAWEQFKSGADPVGGTRLGGLGSGRYDMWRVGLLEFERQPLHGIGANNFAVPYLQQRRGDEQPEYPHSLVVKTLAQLGFVGAVLLAGFVALGFRWSLGPDTPARGIAAAATVAFAAWILHAGVDWLWEIPACGLTAFALLGLAAGVRAEPGARVGGRARLRALLHGAGAVAVVAAAASLGFPWVSARYEASAVDTWRANPAAAYAELERAGSLNPLSERPYLLRGAIASRLGDRALMASSFERALERNPLDWYAHLELAIALSLTGGAEEERAARHLARAVELNPGEPVIRRVQETLAAGRTVDPAEIDRVLLEHVRTL
ncbi:MAG: O-antigen ligase family protein [Gaiellaceae bacterium MAG52_C11]|nr:O-antigen ligase family protein [Candidatus Gaiellasilicea maunaloa]